MSAFDRATAVEPLGDGRYAATVDTAWNAPRGPNGGYLAALVVRAVDAAVADPGRAARSLTLHYLRAPQGGPVGIDVTVERTGRSLTSVSARMTQDDRLCVLALGAWAVDFPAVLDYAQAAPEAPPPDEVAALPSSPEAPGIFQQLEVRPVFGPTPFSGGDEALTGGWLRTREPTAPDAAALAMYCDAWLPAPFTRMEVPAPAPTVDLTIHFRVPLPRLGADPLAPLLAVFRSQTSAHGYFEEDGLVYDAAGTLLAQSRQLALLIPARP